MKPLAIHHIASGSDGNAILVDDGQTKLLFDAGLPYKKLARKIAFSQLAGVFVTHEHADHSKAVPELLRRGIPVFLSRGTWMALEIESGPFYAIKHKEAIRRGTFQVMAFNVHHDAAEPLGFLFESQYGAKGIYIADSAYVNYSFKGITHFLIECNYTEEKLAAGEYSEFLKNRIRRTHMSFANIKRFLANSDLSKAEEIHLIHLSSANSDAKRFVKEIQELTGVPTYTKDPSYEGYIRAKKPKTLASPKM